MTAWKDKTPEQKQRTRDYSYNHFKKTRCVDSPKKQQYKAVYGSWVQPLVGDRILIGPFKNKNVVMVQRMKIVKKLIEEGNAREFDIKCLALYESGYFDELPE